MASTTTTTTTTPTNTAGLIQNYHHTFEIDTSGGASTAKWAFLEEGIQTVSVEGNETVDQTAYYSGDGFASSDITGGQPIFSFEGHRYYGDTGQDYIAGLMYKYGTDRKTKFRTTDVNTGETVTCDCTVANIVCFGGDAPSKQTFSFEIHFNGQPTIGTAS